MNRFEDDRFEEREKVLEIPKDVEELIDVLNEKDFDAFVVGGAVRDAMLGKEPNDWDLATSAHPREIIDIFKEEGYQVIPTGIDFGTVTVIVDKEPIEITTFRSDGEYSDGRRPDSVTYASNIVEDLSRRDFTINAMAYSPRNGLIDPFRGQDDIKGKSIKAVGIASERFKEDSLRMMRAVRFSTRLDYKIEEKTKDAIKENKDLIKNVSQERIRDELSKTLLTDRPSQGINTLRETGLLDKVLPEIVDTYNFDQKNLHHDKDVYNHTLDVIDKVSDNIEVRMAALFHDSGKPKTFELDENNQGRFFGHEKESAKLAEEAMTRLTFSNKEIEHVKTLVKNHMTMHDDKPTDRSVKRFMNRVGEDRLENMFDLFKADRMSSAPEYQDVSKIEELENRVNKIIENQEPIRVTDLDIDGHDLMDYGIRQGPEIGKTLNGLMEKVLDNPELNNKEILLSMIKDLD